VGPRRVTLLRHGQAQAPDSCPDDFERVLTHRGELEAREMAARLLKRGLIPDLILVSPANRAWGTAEIVAATCEMDAKQIQCARELYLASPETTWGLLAQRASSLSHILVCGHNPGLSQVASRLGPKTQARELATAAIATAVWHHGDWSHLLPETADSCQMDEPENLTDLWV
jgi:phosphohistidine phosphatase